MRACITYSGASIVCLIVLLCTGSAHYAPESRLRLLVPAYFYPAGDGLKEWDRLLRSPGLEDVTVIVNPASGPGNAADSNYTALLERIRKTKVTVIGYVSTSYAKRPIADVKADVDRWLTLYPFIQGIFFDEQASGLPALGYYRELYRYVRNDKKLSLVVNNPGTVCDEDYLRLPCADTVCLFEGVWKVGAIDLPAWTLRHPAEQKYVLPYGVGTADGMREILKTAAARGAGTIYITDATGENPWRRLPAYWEEEVAAVRAANAGKRRR